MEDATDMEHTAVGPGVDATDRRRTGEGAIDTEEEPGGDTTDTKGQG